MKFLFKVVVFRCFQVNQVSFRGSKNYSTIGQFVANNSSACIPAKCDPEAPLGCPRKLVNGQEPWVITPIYPIYK